MKDRSSKRPLDRYQLYTECVQSPEHDAKFLRNLYIKIACQGSSSKRPTILREDFCGTHALSSAWILQDAANRAIGIDIDKEPLKYGHQRDLNKLRPEQSTRLTIINGDVLGVRAPKSDIVCAFNFSYYCFHSRRELLSYFKSVRRTLSLGGIFVVDIFGGPQHAKSSLDKRRLSSISYTFEQEFFDPLTNRTRFHLSFKVRDGRELKRAFSYDWRMWSIPEVREVMVDAGFGRTYVYWEGTGRDGRGSGRYYRRERGEECEVWTGYVVGM